MATFEDLSGKQFGRLLVIRRRVQAERTRNTYWICQCLCGSPEKAIISTRLKAGVTRSCGCLARELARSALTTHGMSKSREFRSWMGMLNRCTNPNCGDYPAYGGRGIAVAFLSFAEFYAEVGPAPQGATIDRIDNDKGYVPGNIRWAKITAQSRNRRSSRLLSHCGKTQTVAQWAEELGIPGGRLRQRLFAGWSAERALTASTYERR